MSEPFSIEDVTVEAETDAALLVVIDGEKVWLPKSGIHDDSEVYAKDTDGTLVVHEWLARKRGWI